MTLLSPRLPLQALSSKSGLSPIVKWVGGKSRLLDELVKHLPAKCRRYFEPFAGGAALFWHLLPENAVLTDTNADLMEMYGTIATYAERVIDKLGLHKDAHCEEHYYKTRELWNESGCTDRVWRAATFIYLNKTCYNGVWRVNKSGEFNVPMGRYDNPPILNEPSLRAATPYLRRAILDTTSFEHTVRIARAGDFVYFDPPYIPTSETADFTTYTKDGFGQVQHELLAETVRELVVRGVQVMVSNSDTPKTRELYEGFDIHQASRPGSINSEATKRGRVGELIITAGY